MILLSVRTTRHKLFSLISSWLTSFRPCKTTSTFWLGNSMPVDSIVYSHFYRIKCSLSFICTLCQMCNVFQFFGSQPQLAIPRDVNILSSDMGPYQQYFIIHMARHNMKYLPDMKVCENYSILQIWASPYAGPLPIRTIAKAENTLCETDSRRTTITRLSFSKAISQLGFPLESDTIKIAWGILYHHFDAGTTSGADKSAVDYCGSISGYSNIIRNLHKLVHYVLTWRQRN